ncbi:VapC toxin family PIN domain ribonuclease [Geodermatophilus sp. TF02-6]|uniref:type II toxin-antitoxin system VapC family toxin n=1 Tax=Geodermatophilus sp. TF02-6 TaxID=2250575 RepID=UPI000DE8EB62|nr:type II toxin-antitoxin system VapC family toxin [Geodermatophilus sp. TF02-6]RBY79864.1 VapC toxin family PIN domain ribonuclease [Geodermatophilus sp. TF02-6]
MLYLDTSLLVALIMTEERTARAHDWLAGVDDDLVTSERARVEVASALSTEQRQAVLDAAGRTEAEYTFAVIADQGLDVLPVETSDFRRAADYVRPPERNLRGADALHIAVAGRLGATVHSWMTLRWRPPESSARTPL